jgi:hypothetical protein
VIDSWLSNQKNAIKTSISDPNGRTSCFIALVSYIQAVMPNRVTTITCNIQIIGRQVPWTGTHTFLMANIQAL